MSKHRAQPPKRRAVRPASPLRRVLAGVVGVVTLASVVGGVAFANTPADDTGLQGSPVGVTGRDGVVSRAEDRESATKAALLDAAGSSGQALTAREKIEVSDAKAFASALMAEYGWAGSEFTCLDKLWEKESHWRVNAENSSSGAYGIPQALPGSKMASVGDDWRTNPETQIRWGVGYIAKRWGTPCAAWQHSVEKHWY